MDNPIISRTGEDVIASNIWYCDVSLDYATTYYWKVRAVNANTSSAWSTTGVFTTEEAPSPEETQTPILEGEVAGINPPTNSSDPDQIQSPPTPTLSTNNNAVPKLNEPADTFDGVPEWVIYLIWGLLGTVILALSIALVIVIKIKRIM
jgi:hypothetical protein